MRSGWCPQVWQLSAPAARCHVRITLQQTHPSPAQRSFQRLKMTMLRLCLCLPPCALPTAPLPGGWGWGVGTKHRFSGQYRGAEHVLRCAFGFQSEADQSSACR